MKRYFMTHIVQVATSLNDTGRILGDNRLITDIVASCILEMNCIQFTR
jgi:hypothetical protein